MPKSRKRARVKEIGRTVVIKNITIYSTYLILVWAFYRFLFQFPSNIEELFIKPVLWLLPLIFLVRKEGFGLSSVGITFKNLFSSVLISVGLGAVFIVEALLTNYLKYHGFNFTANTGGPIAASLGLSLATAISEEISFRGYIFGRLTYALKSEFLANVFQTILWVAIHIPIAFFIQNLSPAAGAVYLILTAIFGFGSAFIYARTNNVAGSILLHILWEWPIILFR